MKNIFTLMIITLSVSWNLSAAATTSATLDALSSALSGGELKDSDLKSVFDGAVNAGAVTRDVPVTAVFSPAVAYAVPVGRYHFEPDSVPVPQLSLLGQEDKFSADFPHRDDEIRRTIKAIEQLESVTTGSPLADFKNTQKVSIIWSNTTVFTSDSYASTKPAKPDEIKTIYLNPKYRELLMDPSDPKLTFLAIVLSHEIKHQSDYEFSGIASVTGKNSIDLLLELSATTQEVYIYNQLRCYKKTTQTCQSQVPSIDKETSDLQKLRLYADIYNYINGGAYPKEADFPQLSTFGKESFGQYVWKMTRAEKKGRWSLLRLVEKLNDFDPSLETLPVPSLIEKLTKTGKYVELQQCKSIENALTIAADQYDKWNNPAPLPPPVQPTPSQGVTPSSQHNNTTGHQSTGHNNGNNHGNQAGSGGTPPLPNINSGSFGNGTGLDNPSAGNIAK